MVRYRIEREDALEPGSRRLQTCPASTPPGVVKLVLALRKQFTEHGLDAGAETIAWHLAHDHDVAVSRATIHRILSRKGAVESHRKSGPAAPASGSKLHAERDWHSPTSRTTA